MEKMYSDRPVVVAFGFSAHNLALMERELSLLWPGRSFCPCMNALDLSPLLGASGASGVLVNLSREYHELLSAFRLADSLSVPVIGAVATDFVNLYCLRACMQRELPAVIGDLEGTDELGEARDALKAGRRFVSRSLLRGDGYRFVDLPSGFDLLSERELLCLDGRLGGLSGKEISERLGLEPSTVTTYTSRAFCKLGVASGEALVWLFAGRPMGCYHGRRRPLRFPLRAGGRAQKKPNQAEA